jgi:hypothetical protein
MSGTNQLMAPPGTTSTTPPGNLLMANANAAAPAQGAPPWASATPQGAPAASPGITPDQIGHLVAGVTRGRTQEQMMRRRDATGPELEILGRIMSDPDPSPAEAQDYMLSLLKSGQAPAGDVIKLLQSMPKDPDMLRTWAHNMFGFVMHMGAHAHAAFPRELFPAEAPPGGPQAPDEEQPS